MLFCAKSYVNLCVSCKFTNLMFKSIIRTYLTLFAVYYIGYSFLNWLLTIKTSIVRIDEGYSNFWIPFSLIYIPAYFILRPKINQSNFKNNIKNGLIWGIFPFSIAIPTAFSQPYFKDVSYNVIDINTPAETHLHPNERFFKVKTFYINRNDFKLFKERHVSGGRSKSLKVNNYYIAPIYSDEKRHPTNVAYGIKFSTSLNHGLLFRKQEPKKIWEFNIHAASEFTFYDLDSVTYFSKQIDSKDAYNFAEAWRENKLLDNTHTPVVLVPSKEPFSKLLQRGKNLTIYFVLISLTVAIGLLLIFDFYR
jgi:rhomboid protease GluP